MPTKTKAPVTKITYSVEEASLACGVGRKLLRAEMDAGHIPYLKWGKRILIPIESLTNIINRTGAKNVKIGDNPDG